MNLFIDDNFWKNFGEIDDDKSSSNKVFPYNGVGFIYGKPASRKTTIAIDTLKTMGDIDIKYYVDCDSKSVKQAKETYENLSKIGFRYTNTLLEGVEPKNKVFAILDRIEKAHESKEFTGKSALVIDTWHQLVEKENDNELAKSLMKKFRSYAQKYKILIVLIAHVGKNDKEDIRGASAISGDATFKILVYKGTNENEYMIEPTKDSLGLLNPSTAIITKSGSISASVIEYSAQIKEESTMKPKDMALQTTMVEVIKEKIEINKYIRESVTDFKEWLFDNYNKRNEFKPSDSLFLSKTFIRDNYSDFIEALFEIEQDGRRKYIIGVL